MGGIFDPPDPPDYDDGPEPPEPCCPVYFRECRLREHDQCDCCNGCATCELTSRPARRLDSDIRPLIELDEEEVPF
jgi:hypothetical protein